MIQQYVHLADSLDKIGLRVFGDAGMACCCDKAEDTEPNLEAEVSLCCIGLWIYTSAFVVFGTSHTSITNWHSQQMRIPEYHLHGLAGIEQLRAAAALAINQCWKRMVETGIHYFFGLSKLVCRWFIY